MTPGRISVVFVLMLLGGGCGWLPAGFSIVEERIELGELGPDPRPFSVHLQSESEELLYASFVVGSLMFGGEVDEWEPEDAPLVAPRLLELPAGAEVEVELQARCIIEMAPGPFGWTVPVVGDQEPVDPWSARISAGSLRIIGSCP